MNPTDAFRKEQRKREIKKNRVERAKVREFSALVRNPEAMGDEIKRLEAEKSLKIADQAKLQQYKRTHKDLIKIQRRVEVASSKEESQGVGASSQRAAEGGSSMGPPMSRATEGGSSMAGGENAGLKTGEGGSSMAGAGKEAAKADSTAPASEQEPKTDEMKVDAPEGEKTQEQEQNKSGEETVVDGAERTEESKSKSPPVGASQEPQQGMGRVQQPPLWSPPGMPFVPPPLPVFLRPPPMPPVPPGSMPQPPPQTQQPQLSTSPQPPRGQQQQPAPIEVFAPPPGPGVQFPPRPPMMIPGALGPPGARPLAGVPVMMMPVPAHMVRAMGMQPRPPPPGAGGLPPPPVWLPRPPVPPTVPGAAAPGPAVATFTPPIPPPMQVMLPRPTMFVPPQLPVPPTGQQPPSAVPQAPTQTVITGQPQVAHPAGSENIQSQAPGGGGAPQVEAGSSSTTDIPQVPAQVSTDAESQKKTDNISQAVPPPFVPPQVPKLVDTSVDSSKQQQEGTQTHVQQVSGQPVSVPTPPPMGLPRPPPHMFQPPAAHFMHMHMHMQQFNNNIPQQNEQNQIGPVPQNLSQQGPSPTPETEGQNNVNKSMDVSTNEGIGGTQQQAPQAMPVHMQQHMMHQQHPPHGYPSPPPQGFPGYGPPPGYPQHPQHHYQHHSHHQNNQHNNHNNLNNQNNNNGHYGPSTGPQQQGSGGATTRPRATRPRPSGGAIDPLDPTGDQYTQRPGQRDRREKRQRVEGPEMGPVMGPSLPPSMQPKPDAAASAPAGPSLPPGGIGSMQGVTGLGGYGDDDDSAVGPYISFDNDDDAVCAPYPGVEEPILPKFKPANVSKDLTAMIPAHLMRAKQAAANTKTKNIGGGAHKQGVLGFSTVVSTVSVPRPAGSTLLVPRATKKVAPGAGKVAPAKEVKKGAAAVANEYDAFLAEMESLGAM